jgi:hypothetical protein
MTNPLETFQKSSQAQIESLKASSAAFAKGLKSVAEETADYSSRSVETTKSFFEKLKGVKTFETAIQLQTDFTKSQFEDFVAQMTKIGEIYKEMGKEVFKPLEHAAATAGETAQPSN